MVHFVKKGAYLSLQKSFHIKGTKKKRTEHIAYLGRADQYTQKQLNEILTIANHNPLLANGWPRGLYKLLDGYKQAGKKSSKSKAGQ